jgi:amidase
MSGYTTIVNLLDYTACALPVTIADKNVDVVDPAFKPLNKLDERVMKTCKFF